MRALRLLLLHTERKVAVSGSQTADSDLWILPRPEKCPVDTYRMIKGRQHSIRSAVDHLGILPPS